MPRRSFSDLKPEEVLMVAIDVEVANGDRLRNFAVLFVGRAPDAAKLFAGMAAEEDEHKALLEAIYDKRYPNLPKTVGQDDVLEVIEEHDLGDADHMVFDSMTLKQALECVLHSELQAQDFYRQAARKSDQPELAELFRDLGALEDNHVQWVETRLDELAKLE